jgi:hypothetical protein
MNEILHTIDEGVEVWRRYPNFDTSVPCKNQISDFGMSQPQTLDIPSKIFRLGYLNKILRKKVFFTKMGVEVGGFYVINL